MQSKLIAALALTIFVAGVGCGNRNGGASSQGNVAAQGTTAADNRTTTSAPAGEKVHGKVDLPVYPGAVVVEKPERAISGGLAYHYQSGDPVETVYSWYKDKLAGGQERMHVEGKIVSYASAGSAAVNVMLALGKNGKTDIILSP